MRPGNHIKTERTSDRKDTRKFIHFGFQLITYSDLTLERIMRAGDTDTLMCARSDPHKSNVRKERKGD